MNNQRVKDTTYTLFQLTESIIQQYEQTKANGSEGDFYTEVLPFSNHVQDLTEKWTKIITPWVTDGERKYINFNQIVSLKEQLEKVTVQAFYPQSSKKHFLNSIHAIQFVLKSILSEVDNHE